VDPGGIAALSKTTKKVLDGLVAYPLIVAFVAVLLRIQVKSEKAIAEGNPPRTFTFRGFRPARSRRWWVMTHIIKTPAGWGRFDRMLFWVGVAGAVLAAGTLVVGTIMAIAS